MVIGRSTPKSVPSRELVGTFSAKRWTDLPSLDRNQKALLTHFFKQVEQRHGFAGSSLAVPSSILNDGQCPEGLWR